MKKVAVVLSGCGFKDGAEVTESVCTLVSLSEGGSEYQVFAPDVEFSATNHIDDTEAGYRSVLQEASRISRGQISKLSELRAEEFDAVVFPGGFGAAKHLCTWAYEGANCQVNDDARRVIETFYAQGKPIGAICIAPALVARVLGDRGVSLTIGNDPDTAPELQKTGAEHVECVVTDYVTDRENKVISTPAYMYEARPHEVFAGIKGLVRELVEMA